MSLYLKEGGKKETFHSLLCMQFSVITSHHRGKEKHYFVVCSKLFCILLHLMHLQGLQIF